MKKIILNSFTKHPYFPLFLFIVSLAVSFGAFWYRDFFEGARTLGLVGLFIINFISSATFFISGPAFLTVIAGGSIYNPLLVAFVASLAASFGDLVSFALGHSSRHIALKRFESHPWFVFLESLFKKHGYWIIFLFALIPNPVFDAVGLIAGVFRFHWKTFFALMLLGRFTRFMILAFLGNKFI